MKPGANSSDQKTILAMHADEVPARKISEVLKIELKVVKSFIKAGKTNFQLSKEAEKKQQEEALKAAEKKAADAEARATAAEKKLKELNK